VAVNAALRVALASCTEVHATLVMAGYSFYPHLVDMAETLIYVDDDPARREVVGARLRLLGYQVLTAPDGEKALNTFSESHIDLVVLDYYMPGMNGDLVAMAMKRMKPEVPIIIFSGTFTLCEMVLAFVDGFVSTSDEPEALLNKIGEVLRPRRVARAS
jgi:DNA-binding NtrC family response regulator